MRCTLQNVIQTQNFQKCMPNQKNQLWTGMFSSVQQKSQDQPTNLWVQLAIILTLRTHHSQRTWTPLCPVSRRDVAILRLVQQLEQGCSEPTEGERRARFDADAGHACKKRITTVEARADYCHGYRFCCFSSQGWTNEVQSSNVEIRCLTNLGNMRRPRNCDGPNVFSQSNKWFWPRVQGSNGIRLRWVEVKTIL